MEMGIVYFIQPAQLLKTNRYKVGASGENNLSRIKAYLKGTRPICIAETTKPFIVEKELLKVFKRKFNNFAGAEYFSGNEYQMKHEFLKIVHRDCYQPKSWLELIIMFLTNLSIIIFLCWIVSLYYGVDYTSYLDMITSYH